MTLEFSERTVAVDSFTEAVATEIRAWMGRRNYKQKDLAEVLHIAQPGASARLRGKIALNTTELASITAWLGISLSELLGPALLNAEIVVKDKTRPATQDGFVSVAAPGLDPGTSRL